MRITLLLALANCAPAPVKSEPPPLHLRFYDVKDLVSPIRDYPGGGGPGSAAAGAGETAPADPEADARPYVHDLIEDLRAVVEPALWKSVDGAEIQTKNNVLVVTATDAIHGRIAVFLADLRRRAAR